MFRYFYRFIVAPLVFDFIIPLIKLLPIKSPKLQRSLELRTAKEWKRSRLESPIWFHCASMEYEYAKPIIRALKEFKPELPILLTYYSPTIEKLVKKDPNIDLALPLPTDTFYEMSGFIRTQNPRALLIARTDAWPEMVLQCQEKRVPTLLFSATLTESSGRSGFLSKLIYRPVFTALNGIFAVSDEDVHQFRQIAPQANVSCQGDTRYDQVIHRVEHPKELKESLFSGLSDPIFLAGSTWSEDEEVLVEVLNRFDKNLRWIIAPHEPSEDHLDFLEAELSKRGIQSIRYTDADRWEENQVLIIDCVGILAELYGKALFAFVGGSYKKTVHSVMEPLAQGCITFVGPYHQNNREAMELKFEPIAGNSTTKMVNVCTSAKALYQQVEDLFSNDISGYKDIIKGKVYERSGASQAVLNWIAEALDE